MEGLFSEERYIWWEMMVTNNIIMSCFVETNCEDLNNISIIGEQKHDYSEFIQHRQQHSQF